MTATYDSFEAYNAANKGARITPRGDLFELYIPRTTIEDAELMSRARQVDPEPKVDLTVTFPGEFMASSGRMLRFEDNVAIWDDNLLEEIGDIMVAGVATASPSVSSPSVASEEPIEAAPTTVAEDLDAPPPPRRRARAGGDQLRRLTLAVDGGRRRRHPGGSRWHVVVAGAPGPARSADRKPQLDRLNREVNTPSLTRNPERVGAAGRGPCSVCSAHEYHLTLPFPTTARRLGARPTGHAAQRLRPAR